MCAVFDVAFLHFIFLSYLFLIIFANSVDIFVVL